jgi:hypothetical protein
MLFEDLERAQVDVSLNENTCISIIHFSQWHDPPGSSHGSSCASEEDGFGARPSAPAIALAGLAALAVQWVSVASPSRPSCP